MTMIPDVRDYKPWRYAPSVTMTLRGWSPVKHYEFIPANSRKAGDAPIAGDYGVLTLHCANGEKRFYGFTEAKINSELRMIVRLSDFHLRDEVVRKWEVCTKV